ncbi:hypothetical protein LUZ61_003881 [Rhynchospora tenuis]|uniref:Beta-fructofuranosidase n=1 Tax=Rhynchospora tenuis TaxID=198213 RepID=A0AAD5ZLT0_9POAL|nr:hypothetical protein LUZ61_003881 [Rhynchospora tenuis]
MGITSREIGKWMVMLVLLWVSCEKTEGSHVLHTRLQETDPNVTLAVTSPALKAAYHFRPPMNWINDPNGPLYYKGYYHLFYQYNPKGAVWGNIVWAHSVSKDLINWIALKPAIYPSKPFDIFGCWSGSATILQDGTPAIIYTGIIAKNDTDPNNILWTQVQNVAYPKNLSDPFLEEWDKPDYNPVIPIETGVNGTAFRDPTTAWFSPKDLHWRLVVGSKWDLKGQALLYRSMDFKKWVKANHTLHATRGTGMWECPDFYPVSVKGLLGLDTSAIGQGVKHVLKVSLDLDRYEYYTIGTYNTTSDRYTPDGTSKDNKHGLRYDYGNFYASKTFYDPEKKRRILWGWANETDTVPEDNKKGWAGVQLIPRTVWLDPSGKQLLQWPVEELNSLRGKQVSVTSKTVKPGDHLEVGGIQTVQADVEVSFDVSSLSNAEPFDPKYMYDAQAFCKIKGADVKGGVGPFGLYVLATSDLQEKTAVFFRVFKSEDKHVVLMCNDPTQSTLAPTLAEDKYKPTFAGYVDIDLTKSTSISLKTLLDHSVVESFGAGGKTVISSRVYPTLAQGDNARLFIFNNGATDIEVTKLDAWELKKPLMNIGA